MTLILELPNNKEVALKAKAQIRGVSAEQYAEEVLYRDLEESDSTVPQETPPRHISDVIQEIMRDVPPEIMATMPADGASEHDHYLYGWPKRNP